MMRESDSMQTVRFSWLRRPVVPILVGILLAACGPAVVTTALAQPQVTSEEDETPAPEAPPVRPAGPASPRTKPTRPGVPAPAAGGSEGSVKALASRLDKQSKELTQLKAENARLREQVRLLFSIVNKLAGLSQGR